MGGMDYLLWFQEQEKPELGYPKPGQWYFSESLKGLRQHNQTPWPESAGLRLLFDPPALPTTLDEARAEVREGRKEGTTCPCCGQMAKVYHRTIHATMAKNLIDAYFQFGVSREFRPIEVFGKDSPDFIKLRYWGLLLEVDPDDVRDDGSPRTGRWMLSSKAAGFVREVTTVTKYAVIYNGNLLGTEGEQVSIRDCLVRKFSYDELMDGR